MRSLLRKWLPKSLKINYRLMQRFVKDWKTGQLRFFAKPTSSLPENTNSLSLEQAIFASHLASNKVDNMALAIKSITPVLIRPGEIFSFWKIIGPATPQKGFKPGRNLENGVLVEGFGGGLCQLAGIIYHLSLIGGLEVVERHHHSLDIYDEHERYTPLGADATVVYPYKDLRLRNSFDGWIFFSFELEPTRLKANLHSEKKIVPLEIHFDRKDNGMFWELHTRSGTGKVLAKAQYKKKQI